MKIKYVVYDNFYPVIFGEYFKHTDVKGGYKQATSAGFVRLQEIDTPEDSAFCQCRITKAHCYGESISLNLKSRGEEDARLIDKMLNQ